MKIKTISLNLLLFLIFYLISDVIFSRYIFQQSVDHKCYEHSLEGKFYQMRKNCFSNMRLISSIDSFKVYTNQERERFSGIKKNIRQESIIFLGDSQTFGVGSDWENTFIGMLENELPNFNFFNLGVPSYSPTVYNHTLKKFIKRNKTKISKIFVLIDLTDVSDEATRWTITESQVTLMNEKVFYKKNEGFSKFKKENFKGLYLIASKIRSFFRKLEQKKPVKNNEYRPVDGNPTGAYIYTDHNILTGCENDTKKTNWWKCGDIKKGLKKIEKNIIEIGEIAGQLNSEFYIIIMPWPDTLNFGQTKFNWENFSTNLCEKSNCNDLVNLFPKFENFKKNNPDWLKLLYLNNDIHLTKTGNDLVAKEIKSKAFN